ncbi:MAG TPA: Ig-like domain-containing protein, partial [Thermoanaerobaculia bacterium]
AVGIPITPFDDRGVKNYYTMMRFTARDAGGTVLATADVVLPVSDEMDCRACHASGGSPAARPAIGWAFDTNPSRDVKLNVLAIHDQHQAANTKYRDALAAQGYDASGLRATALGGKPVLCARCHPSNALPGLGITSIQPLTTAIHSRHSDVVDPTNGLTLEATANRGSCYRCHPGAETKCLRGVMGAAVAADASYAMQCQSCHGSMSEVGSATRVGWLQEPACQNCHTGTATANAGAIRYTSAFTSPGVPRTAPNATFATNPNTPAAGVSLYRFSTGHGDLQCEACHGSTHAELASTEANDNVQSTRLQGHNGMLAECETCHATVPSTVTGGPHGLHPLGASWVARHGDAAEGSSSSCSSCHGSDYRGSVLSRALGPRQLVTKFGNKDFWRGYQVGCYTCHEGPGSESATRNHAPAASDGSASTTAATPVTIALRATDPDFNPLTLRVVSRPAHGRAGIAGTTATYIPDSGFAGTDSFTFAAWDGSIDSNLGTISIAVAQPPASARVTVTKSGSGSGLVTSTPATINCGSVCSGAFPPGANVTLFAQPDQDARFDGWSGPCTGTGPCSFTVSGDTTVIALFTYAPATYVLTVTRSGNGRGVVKSTPDAIDCGEKCSATLNLGTAVTLTATPESTSTFTGWSGACSGTGPCAVSMTQQRNVTATFTTLPSPGRRRSSGH